MTAFETLYAHLKAMNYKDAPLFVDGKLLFLNVGENYHLLYSDNSLFVINFVDSIVQHYWTNKDELRVEQNRSNDYLHMLDKIPYTFFHLMPAYLYYCETSGQHKPNKSILDIQPQNAQIRPNTILKSYFLTLLVGLVNIPIYLNLVGKNTGRDIGILI